MTSITNPFPYFPEAGTGGYIYVGTANLDARTNPITVYRDKARTLPWAQPIRTINGYPAYQGAQTGIYTALPSVSLTVLDARGKVQINTLLATLAIDASSVVTDAGNTLEALARVTEGQELNAEMYRDGIRTDQQILAAAFTASSIAGLPVAISETYTMTSTITVEKLRIVGRGGTIIGGNFQGFNVTGAACLIDIRGDLTVQGFYNSADRYGQATNYLTGFCRIAIGAQVSTLTVGPGVKAIQCRSFIRSGLTTDEIGPDWTALIDRIDIRGLYMEECPRGICIRCPFTQATLIGNTAQNSVGSMVLVCPFDVYVDGSLIEPSTRYVITGNVVFTNNIVDTAVCLNAAGGVNGGLASAHDVVVIGNILRHIYGAATLSNIEAYYSKATRAIYQGNICYNAGASEGALANKGISPEEAAAGATSPPGQNSKYTGNIIVYDTYTYNLTALWGTGGTVTLFRRGILAQTSQGVEITDNLIVGVNGTGAIEVRAGVNALGGGRTVCDNLILGLLGTTTCTGIFLSGAALEENVSRNHIEFAAGNNVIRRGIVIADNASSGIRREMSVFRDNTFHIDDTAQTATVRGIEINLGSYPVNGFDASGSAMYANVNASAQVQLIALFSTSFPSANFMDNFRALDLGITQRTLVSAQSQLVAFLSTNTVATVRSYEISGKIRARTTDGSTFRVSSFGVPPQGYVKSYMEAMGARTDTPGTVILRKLDAVAQDSGGTAPAFGTTTALIAGTASTNLSAGVIGTATTTLTVSDSRKCAEFNVVGNAAQTWEWTIDVAASCVTATAA
jgi:hypothetical protein